MLKESRGNKKFLGNGTAPSIMQIAKELDSLLRSSETKVRAYKVSGALLSAAGIYGIFNAAYHGAGPNTLYAGTVAVVTFAGCTLLHLSRINSSNIETNKRLLESIIKAMAPPTNRVI